MPYVDNFTIFCGDGMIESMLEPHLKNSEAMATQFQVAMVFFVFGGSYMLSTPAVGYVCKTLSENNTYFTTLNLVSLLIVSSTRPSWPWWATCAWPSVISSWALLLSWPWSPVFSWSMEQCPLPAWPCPLSWSRPLPGLIRSWSREVIKTI